MTKLDYGHTPETLRFWRGLARRALKLAPAPSFVLASSPIGERLAEVAEEFVAAGFRTETANLKSPVAFRHWLSCKTQPVRPLLAWWRRQGRPIEVVSEFELRAALAEGFAPEHILANGPAKHHWLAAFPLTGLNVHFDSVAEVAPLLPVARKCGWRLGIRLLTKEEYDPENPGCPTQFGFTPDEAATVARKLLRAGARLENIHFHLRTNVASVRMYANAIAEAAAVCRAARFEPLHLDIGGGVPVRHVRSRGGKVYDGEFGLRSFARMLRQAPRHFPGLREVWLENGRFLSAGSGALVLRILDVKERRGVRQLICNGGRTLHALNSLWEQHELLALPERSGPETLTIVHGPTCMAFDQIARLPLPRSLKAGDHLIWLDAGAYHIPWETRFSHGHAAVCWQDELGLRVVRPAEAFNDWWGPWKDETQIARNAGL